MSNGYETHLRLLTKYAMQAQRGDTICELGCGFYSSPVLYSVCESLGVEYVIYYSEEKWAGMVRSRLGKAVTFIKVPNWGTWVPDRKAHMYLLDNEELVVNRYKTLHKLSGWAKKVVVHDADTYIKRGVPLAASHKVVDHDGSSLPHTAVIDLTVAVVQPPMPPVAGPCQVVAPAVVIPGKPIKAAVVCAFVPGGDYDSHYREYVQRLSDGLIHTPNRPDFFCVTYMTLDGVTGVTRIDPKNNFKGWHIKGEVFNSDLWEGYDRVLYVDLDTVIRGDLTAILSNPANFGMLRDFNKPAVMETGVVWFDPTITGGLYDRFVGANPTVRKKDADIVNDWVKDMGMKAAVCPLQDFFRIGSYKIHMVKGKKSPEGFDIVCFHGNPRPHHVDWSLAVPETAQVTTTGKVKYHAQPVPPMWTGQDVFVIGGGPSIADLDLSVLFTSCVIGVNDAYKFPCASVCFFGDTAWEGHHQEGLKNFIGKVFTTSGIQNPRYHHLDMLPSGISADKKVVGWNKNSGFAAINLACHLGAKRIFLVGFDMKFRNGESNYHPNIRKVNSNTYSVFLKGQKAIAEGLQIHFPKIKVLNANPDSAMTAFPKVTFAEAVAMSKS